jgi:dephospho-CoA kinase
MVEAQMPNEEKRKRATWVIDNDGTMEDLKARVKEVILELESPGPAQ